MRCQRRRLNGSRRRHYSLLVQDRVFQVYCPVSFEQLATSCSGGWEQAADSYWRCSISIRLALYYSCMLCAPSVFKDGAGYTVRDIISAAIESCKCMGYQIDDINLSALGEAEDESLGGGGTCYGGSSSRQAEPTEDNESSAGDDAGTMASVTSTPQEDASTSSKASATFIPASKISTAEIANDSPGSSASSASASGTGAASTIQAQQVLAFLVATAASAVSFSYIF
jgi:hypothetical protein